MLGNKRRSFFLFVIPVSHSPRDLKCTENRPAEKREQKNDLFKRHGASPLSALEQEPGVRKIQRKNRLTRRAQVPVRSKPPAFGTQRLHTADAALTEYHIHS